MSEAQQRRQMEYIPLSDLSLTELRDVRPHVVDDIAERIDEDEYNPSRPLRVIANGSGYKVIDGNHRVKALQKLDSIGGSKSIPCVVEPDGSDIHRLAHKSNKDEDTYAEEDLFDHLDYIEGLREEHTQQEIADKMGWSRELVKDYVAVKNKIGEGVLQIAKDHQSTRSPQNGESSPTHDFTQWWFRTSDLYDLQRDGTTEYAKPGEEEAKHVAHTKTLSAYLEPTKDALYRCGTTGISALSGSSVPSTS